MRRACCPCCWRTKTRAWWRCRRRRGGWRRPRRRGAGWGGAVHGDQVDVPGDAVGVGGGEEAISQVRAARGVRGGGIDEADGDGAAVGGDARGDHALVGGGGDEVARGAAIQGEQAEG